MGLYEVNVTVKMVVRARDEYEAKDIGNSLVYHEGMSHETTAVRILHVSKLPSGWKGTDTPFHHANSRFRDSNITIDEFLEHVY